MKLFDAVDAVSRALSRYELNLGVTWYDAEGGLRRARLTERGRQYVKRLREPRDIARSTEYTYLGPAAEQISLPVES
ncbi:hypothetical protein QFZ66_004473 [Streptomyces sp. B4I13]|uniref:hypothetical protein n=1 Tax=Streptomyces sp. B4I13 TaxID=3042271 RepID=UPI002785340F|nr:hypothetical protein [Streptomyces sp. B4I13]MDQ0960595.1 hypothetical protein [Streptomyces sp. B4I13]